MPRGMGIRGREGEGDVGVVVGTNLVDTHLSAAVAALWRTHSGRGTALGTLCPETSPVPSSLAGFEDCNPTTAIRRSRRRYGCRNGRGNGWRNGRRPWRNGREHGVGQTRVHCLDFIVYFAFCLLMWVVILFLHKILIINIIKILNLY